MIVAIATDKGCVSPHFGRCQAYTMVTIAGGKVVTKEELANPGHAPGAIPEYLNKKGVKKVICGGIGAKAMALFGQYGIEIIAGVENTVENVITGLLKGTLTGGDSLCRPGDGRGYGIEKTECEHTDEE